MEFKGTKAPWVVGFSRKMGHTEISFIEVSQKEGFKTICKTFDINTHPNKLEYKNFETGLANANLIAAAPELLEALQKMNAWCRTLIDWSNNSNAEMDPPIKEAELIINKALGK